MENFGILIYFYSIYDNLLNLLHLVVSISTSLFIVGGFSGFIVGNMILSIDYTKLRKALKYLVILIIVSVLLQAVLPPKEYLPVIMFGEDIAKEVQESVQSGKLNKLNELLDLKLDSMLNELKETHNKEGK